MEPSSKRDIIVALIAGLLSLGMLFALTVWFIQHVAAY